MPTHDVDNLHGQLHGAPVVLKGAKPARNHDSVQKGFTVPLLADPVLSGQEFPKSRWKDGSQFLSCK
jgi:hypothetical protein